MSSDSLRAGEILARALELGLVARRERQARPRGRARARAAGPRPREPPVITTDRPLKSMAGRTEAAREQGAANRECSGRKAVCCVLVMRESRAASGMAARL